MKIKTIPREARETAKPQPRASARVWTVVKYTFLTVCGVLLYRVAAAYALMERGYYAVGGEVFALFLPVLFYIGSVMWRDMRRELQTLKEENKNEETC